MRVGGVLCPVPTERKGALAEDGRQERAELLIPVPIPIPTLVSFQHMGQGSGWLIGLRKGEGRQDRSEALIE